MIVAAVVAAIVVIVAAVVVIVAAVVVIVAAVVVESLVRLAKVRPYRQSFNFISPSHNVIKQQSRQVKSSKFKLMQKIQVQCDVM
ncbi:hypothetical protein Tco_1102023 [Tanacetum coccineum]